MGRQLMRLLNSLKNTLTVSDPEPSASVDIPLSVAFDLLANDRRRHAIRILADVDDEMTVRELSQRLADIEEDTSRKTMYIALYQSHLPALANADSPVIEYDSRAGVVTPTTVCHTLDDLRVVAKEILD